MKTKTNVIVISSAAVLLVAGILIAVLGFASGGSPGFYINNTGIHPYNSRGFGGDYNQNYGAANTAPDNEMVTLDSFENIELSVTLANITLIQSDKNAVEYRLSEQEELTVCKVENQTFRFSSKFRSGLNFNLDFFSGQHSYVKIYYKDADALKDVSINVVSGRIEADDLTISDRLSIESVSGDIKLSNLTTSSAAIHTTSGGVTVQGKLMGDTTVDVVSGTITVNTSLPKEEYSYSISTVSGDGEVDRKGFEGDHTNDGAPHSLKANTVSGDINLNFDSNQ